jgi:Uma2 family endonuclease
LGLLAEKSGLAAQILESRGVSFERVRREVDRMIEGRFIAGVAKIPLSPTAKRSLELAIDAAYELSHSKVNTAHLLLGLIRQGQQGEGVAMWILRNLEVDLEKLEQETQLSLRTSIHQETANLANSNAGAGSVTPCYLDINSAAVAARLVNLLVLWVVAKNLGQIFNSNIGFQLPNGDVVPLGISFVLKEYLPVSANGYLKTPPNLVIEIKSIDRNWFSIQNKIQMLLNLGSQVGVVINPEEQTVTVYYPEGKVSVLSNEDCLEIPLLLPGWSLPIASLWVSSFL